MTNESNTISNAIKELAKSFKEDGSTKEEMAVDLFEMGATFETVVKVSLQMDYLK